MNAIIKTHSFNAADVNKRIWEIERRFLHVLVHHYGKVFKIHWWWTDNTNIVFKCFRRSYVYFIIKQSCHVFTRVIDVVALHINSEDKIFAYFKYMLVSSIFEMDFHRADITLIEKVSIFHGNQKTDVLVVGT